MAVRLTDGRELVSTAGAIWGDAANPAPRERLHRKFLVLAVPCARRRRGPRPCWSRWSAWTNLTIFARLTRLLGGDGAEAAP